MDFRQLESFLCIAKHLSFSNAARELYLTQPTISNHIRLLEEELGITLFHRSSWQVSLTEQGQLFLPYAQDILQRKEAMLEKVSESARALQAKLTIHASSIPESYLLPEYLAGFRQEFPESMLQVRHRDSFEIVDDILEERIGFGFTGLYKKDRKLIYRSLAADELYLVGPPGDSKKINPQDIPEIPLIMREEGSGHRNLLSKVLKKKGVEFSKLNIVAYAESITAIKAMVEKGIGYSFLSRFALEEELRDKRLTHHSLDELDLTREFYFVYHKDLRLSPLEQKFVEYMETKSGE